MTLQLLLNERNMTKYRLSKISGVPKTTIIDICSGKSSIEKCSAKTVQLLSRALGITMEDMMNLEEPARYDSDTNLPEDKSYLECNLPSFLYTSIENMKKSWAIQDSGKTDSLWDCYWCELSSDINAAEVENIISSEQAWYLREKYLRMRKEESL